MVYRMNKKEEEFVEDLRALCQRHKVIIESPEGMSLRFDNPKHNTDLVFTQSSKTKEFLPKEVFENRVHSKEE